MKELAEQVKEYYPTHPELAFRYFSSSYPEVISATIVSMVWSYIEVEARHHLMMKTGMKYTRPMERKDISIFRNPFAMN